MAALPRARRLVVSLGRHDICLSRRAKSTKPALDVSSPVCSARHRPFGRGRRPSTACETTDQIGAAMRLYCACIAGACPPAVRGDINSRNGHGIVRAGASRGRPIRHADSHHAIPDEGLTRGIDAGVRISRGRPKTGSAFRRPPARTRAGRNEDMVIFPRARGTRRRNGWACILLIGAYRASLSLTQAGSGPETCIGRFASPYVDELKTTLTQRPARIAPGRRK